MPLNIKLLKSVFNLKSLGFKRGYRKYKLSLFCEGGRGAGSGHSNGHAVVSVGRSFLAAGAAARAWATTTKVCGKIQAHLGQGGRFVGRRTGWCQFGRRGNCSRRRGGGVYNRIFAAGWISLIWKFGGCFHGLSFACVWRRAKGVTRTAEIKND